MEKGILTAAQEAKLASMLDDAIKLKGFLEIIDGFVFKAVITFVDDNYLDKLSTDIKTQLAAIVDAVLANNVDQAETLVADMLTTLVNVPGLDKTTEGLLFKGVVELLAGAILKWIEGQKGTKVTLA
jgi:hypothetical protein